EYALGYTKERVTFGKKVAHHQGVAFILADMSISIEAARMAVWKGIYGLSKGDGLLDGSQALIQSIECASFVTNYGVQLLGGHGYVKDYPVEKWMREARTLSSILGGTDGAQMDLEESGIKEWGFA
ncbi:MAG: acyl-CoA dehydrogenase, partial [Deltaproteobacteria bacterium]|nr:acyl-CoA dehydrogenase [Deltaproteobacteria bacterium]